MIEVILFIWLLAATGLLPYVIVGILLTQLFKADNWKLYERRPKREPTEAERKAALKREWREALAKYPKAQDIVPRA